MSPFVETAWYLASSTAVALGILAIGLVCGVPVAALWAGLGPAWRGFLSIAGLMALVVACGVPANLIYVLLLRDRYYIAADPVVDWLPWIPSGDWILDTACGGRYINGATAWWIRGAWAALAIPTWCAAITLWRRIS